MCLCSVGLVLATLATSNAVPTYKMSRMFPQLEQYAFQDQSFSVTLSVGFSYSNLFQPISPPVINSCLKVPQGSLRLSVHIASCRSVRMTPEVTVSVAFGILMALLAILALIQGMLQRQSRGETSSSTILKQSY